MYFPIQERKVAKNTSYQITGYEDAYRTARTARRDETRRDRLAMQGDAELFSLIVVLGTIAIRWELLQHGCSMLTKTSCRVWAEVWAGREHKKQSPDLRGFEYK